MESLRVAKNAVLNSVNIIVSLLAGIAVSIIITRYLGPERYGQYQTAMTVVSTGTFLLGLGMIEMLRRYVAELDGRAQRATAFRLALTVLAIQFVVAVASVLLLAFGAQSVANLLRQPLLTGHIILASFILGPELLSAVLQHTLVGFQRFASLTIVGIGRAVLMVGGVSLVASTDMGISGILKFMVILSSVTGIAYGGMVYRLWREQGGGDIEATRGLKPRPLLTYCAASFFTLLMDAFAWQRTGVYFLSIYSSATEIGFYTLGSGLAYLAVSTIPMGLLGVLVPALTERWGAEDHERMNRIYEVSLRAIAVISLPICAGGIGIARPLTLLLYGQSYARAASVLAIMLAATAALVMTSPAASALHAIRRPDVLAKIAAVIAILNVALLAYLVPRYGALGAALANLLVRVVAAVMTLGAVGRLLRLRYEVRAFALNSLAAAGCGAFAFAIVTIDSRPPALVASIFGGALIYIVLLLALKVVSKEERTLLVVSITTWLGAHWRRSA